MKTKFAIGCLVQWYEADIVNDYFDTLQDALNGYDEYVSIDILLCTNQELERAESNDVVVQCTNDIIESARTYNFEVTVTDRLITIADYRRTFNEKYCHTADVLIWGETDMLVPKQAFVVLDMLHQSQKIDTPKYIATFGICKMWDDTWKPLEHPAFTDKQHSDDKKDWWSLNYDMSKEEMNTFNDDVSQLDIRVINPHKFNGCGLVISSEVIKSGVNIPNSVFFIHEDTSFMLMTNKLLGSIPQYHIKNILMVHNRKHLKKRTYVNGETGNTIGQKRNSNKWYTVANKMCEQNVYNLFNPNYTAYTWTDVWKQSI
jgi:hypothetical protein